MSVQPLDLVNQTTLVPNNLLGYSSNQDSAIQITPTEITIAGNLNTTPVYVGISSSTGLTTTRAGGLNVNCDFDMNNNYSINNIYQIKYGTALPFLNISQAVGLGFDISNGFHTSGYMNNGNGSNTIYCNAGNNGGGILIDNQFNSQMTFTNGIRLGDTFSNSIVGSSTGLAVTGLITGTITSSDTVNVNNTSANATHYLTFVDTNTTGYKIPQATNGLTFNPNSNTLSTTSFVGDLTGNSSTATTATTINTTSDNTNTTCYLTFVKGTAGTGKTLFIDDTTGTLNYNPSTGLLTTPILTSPTINVTNVTLGGGIQYPTSTSSASFAGTTLTIASTTARTYTNFNVTITGTTNTISTCAFSAFPVNAESFVNIYNAGTGNLTINSTGFGGNYRTTYSSPVVVSTLGTAIIRINYLNFPTVGSVFVLSASLVST